MATPLPVGATTSAILQPSDLHALVERYAIHLSWPLLVEGGNIYLPTHLGIVGLSMTAGLGGEAHTEFKRRNLHAPIVVVPGRPRRWVFLVAAPSGYTPIVPARVELIAGPRFVPLPPSRVDGAAVRWLVEPTGGLAWLPQYVPALGAVCQVALTGSL
jgi:hypothetical protein